MPTHLEDIAEGLELTSEAHIVTADEIRAFCELSGDFNRLHTDDDFARSVGFRERIAHGLLILSITSGQPTPADDWVLHAYLEETRRFLAPVYPGDAIRSLSRVTSLRRSSSKPDRGVVTMDVEVVNQDGVTVQTGVDIVLVAARETPG